MIRLPRLLNAVADLLEVCKQLGLDDDMAERVIIAELEKRIRIRRPDDVPQAKRAGPSLIDGRELDRTIQANRPGYR